MGVARGPISAAPPPGVGSAFFCKLSIVDSILPLCYTVLCECGVCGKATKAIRLPRPCAKLTNELDVSGKAPKVIRGTYHCIEFVFIFDIQR